MPDMTTNGPPAGWYQNPDDPSQTRWWDGAVWTEHLASDANPTSTPAPAPAPAEKVTLNGPGYNPYDPARDLAAKKNTPATTGFILALASLLVNPVLLVGIGGLIWGIVGLSRANKWAAQGYPPIGKKRAIWAIVVGSIGTVLSIALKGFLF